MRNRVVAGMCEAVIVVESAVAGGSMITARFAGEQGRQIMAVPGRIDQSSSGGCHQLIRDGATMLTSVDDILEELRYVRPMQTEAELPMESETVPAELSDLERQVFDCFTGGELCLPDQISQQLKRPSSEVSATLMGLELKRLVVKRADGRFEAH
jgi:DNA processing protein